MGPTALCSGDVDSGCLHDTREGKLHCRLSSVPCLQEEKFSFHTCLRKTEQMVETGEEDFALLSTSEAWSDARAFFWLFRELYARAVTVKQSIMCIVSAILVQSEIFRLFNR